MLQPSSVTIERWAQPGQVVTSPKKWTRPEEMDHQPKEREQQPRKLGHHPGEVNCHSLQWVGKIKSRVQQWLWSGVSADLHKYMFVNTLSVTNSLGTLPFWGTLLGSSFKGDTP